MAEVPWGWGSDIETVKPRLKTKGVPSQLVNKVCVYEPNGGCLLETVGSGIQRQNLDFDQEATKCFKEVGGLESQEDLTLSLNTSKQIFGKEILEESIKPIRVEVPEEEKMIDFTQGNVVNSFKVEVGKFESQVVLENEERDSREILYRGILESNLVRQKVRKLTCDRSFTRALTDKGGKLVRDIKNYSSAKVEIHSHEEENVVLGKGEFKT